MSGAPTLAEAPPRAFPGASCGADVVPGRVSRVLDVATELEQVCDGLLRLSALMQRIAVPGWQGRAARWCQHAISFDSRPVGRAGSVMAQAADHLRQHAAVLARAQQVAQDAVTADLQAARVTADWARAGAAGRDPMADTRMMLTEQVDRARTQVRASGADAAAALRSARDLAPQHSTLQRQLSRALDSAEDIDVGLVKGTADLLAPLLLTSVQQTVNPTGYRGDDAAQALRGAATHPGRTTRALLDLDTWDESKTVWGASLVPATLVTVATAGTGSAARLSTFAARVHSMAPGAEGLALRTAIREQRLYGREGLRVRDLTPYASEPSRIGTVTRLAPLDHAVAKAVARDAAHAEPGVTPRIERVADRLGGTREYPDTVLKGGASLNRKLAGDLAGASGRPAPVAGRVNDAVRYTIVYPDDVYVARSVQTVEQLRHEGFQVVEAKSFWGKERYQGLNITVRDPVSGRLLEVQTHTADSFRAGGETHADYDLYRDVGIDPERKAALERVIGDRYRLVPPPPGIGDLPAALARLGQDAPATSTAPGLLSHDPRAVAQNAAATLGATGATRASATPADEP
ncbi:hypothetical protein [Angustibacter luteus]|uniref:Putative T7SS secretion signal domain-containing protein n=1 Tax=Angustibacter luteus TaxID=658456 RepID=A0ABW1JAQ0_9ACTN